MQSEAGLYQSFPRRKGVKFLKIVIIGNGVAGITCAFTARELDPNAQITVISGETDYFFSRTALMYAYMDMMNRRDLEPYERKTYRQKNIELIKDWVIDLNVGKKQVMLEGGGQVSYDALVFAVGASPNMFPWDGIDQINEGLVHFVSMQDLDECERLTPSTKEAVVIGGGLIGIELVECLLHHKVKTTFLIREPYYWPMALGREEGDFVAEHMREHGVDIRLSEEMVQARSDSQGRVSSIVTSQGNEIPCQMLGIAAGVRPNISRLKNFAHAPEMGRGIIVNEHLQTSIPDIYAAGDCAEIHPSNGKPYGELIWYSAKRHGKLVAENILGQQKLYKPPLFFNSSKFFEVEYTTVGEVNNAPEGTPTIYRKMPGKPVSQRIVHNGEHVIGFNMLGSRWNHEVLEQWIHQKRSHQYVLEHLHEAQFDVEFGRATLNTMTTQEIPLTKI